MEKNKGFKNDESLSDKASGMGTSGPYDIDRKIIDNSDPMVLLNDCNSHLNDDTKIVYGESGISLNSNENNAKEGDAAGIDSVSISLKSMNINSENSEEINENNNSAEEPIKLATSTKSDDVTTGSSNENMDSTSSKSNENNYQNSDRERGRSNILLESLSNEYKDKSKSPLSFRKLSDDNEIDGLGSAKARSPIDMLRGESRRRPAYSIDFSGSSKDLISELFGAEGIERSSSDDFGDNQDMSVSGGDSLNESKGRRSISSIISSPLYSKKLISEPISRPSQIRKHITLGAVRRQGSDRKIGTVKTYSSSFVPSSSLASSILTSTSPDKRSLNKTPPNSSHRDGSSDSIDSGSIDGNRSVSKMDSSAVAEPRISIGKKSHIFGQRKNSRSTWTDEQSSPGKALRTLSIDADKVLDSEASGDSSSSSFAGAMQEANAIASSPHPPNFFQKNLPNRPPLGSIPSLSSSQFRSRLRRLSKTDSFDSISSEGIGRTMSLSSMTINETNSRILKGINFNRHRMAHETNSPGNARRFPGLGIGDDNTSEIGSVGAMSTSVALGSLDNPNNAGTVTVDEQSKALLLGRGGVRVNTSIGAIQFGIPPETIKDSLKEGLEVPSIFVVPKERFDARLGINLCEVEFPAYFSFFIKKRSITLVSSEEGESVVREVLKETLEGPEKEYLYTDFEYVDFDITGAPIDPNLIIPEESRLRFDARPDHVKEIDFFKRPREGREITVDSLVKFVNFVPKIGGMQEQVSTNSASQQQKQKKKAKIDENPMLSELLIPYSTNSRGTPASDVGMEDSPKSLLSSPIDSPSFDAIPRSSTPIQVTQVADLGDDVFIEDTGAEYVIWDKGKVIARVDSILASHIPVSQNQDVAILPQNVVDPPVFGVTVLGSSHGFDATGSTSGFVLWINKRGIMVDPPPNATTILQACGIVPNMIDCVILTHCHADHDAGTFQKILKEGRVMLMTTRTISDSFIRKYAVISGFTEAFLCRLFEPRYVKIGESVPYNGATLRFFYSLHAIPCVGFEASYLGKTFVYSADTFYDPEGLLKLHEEGVLSKERYQALLDFPFHYDLVLHEAGIPPIHTPVTVLQRVPEEYRKNLYIIHIAEAAAGKSELKLAKAGVENTIVIQKDNTRADDTESLIDVVRHTDLFKQLSLTQVQDILKLCIVENYEPGELVCQAGDVGSHFYLILGGFAVVELTSMGSFRITNENADKSLQDTFSSYNLQPKSMEDSVDEFKSSSQKVQSKQERSTSDLDDHIDSDCSSVVDDEYGADVQPFTDDTVAESTTFDRSRQNENQISKPLFISPHKRTIQKSSSRVRSLSQDSEHRPRGMSLLNPNHSFSKSPLIQRKSKEIIVDTFKNLESSLSDEDDSKGDVSKSQTNDESIKQMNQMDEKKSSSASANSKLNYSSTDTHSVSVGENMPSASSKSPFSTTENMIEIDYLRQRSSTLSSSPPPTRGRDESHSIGRRVSMSANVGTNNDRSMRDLKGSKHSMASLLTQGFGTSKQSNASKLFGAGDYLGEGAMFDGSVRSASIRAFTKLKVISFDEKCFFMLLKMNPSFRERISRLAKIRASGSWKAIEANSVFSRLGATPRSDLQSILSVKTIPAQTKLWTKGEPVKISCLLSVGEMTFVEMHEELEVPFKRGAFLCDIVSILNQRMIQSGEEPDGPIEASVTLLALTDCTVYTIENDDAIDFLNKNPGVFLNLVDSLVIE